MNELAEQLVRNREQQDKCLEAARRAASDLIVAVSFGDDEGLAEFDVFAASQALKRIGQCKADIRKLRTSYQRLATRA